MKQKMWESFVCVMAMVLVGVMGASIAYAREARKKAVNPVGKEYYTMANIWYERPDKILSTNFHRGIMIPAGTKVTIIYFKGKKINFTEVETEESYTYLHAKKHSKITLRELFNRYFSKDDPMRPGGPFEKFTVKEQENVMDGTLNIGLSKDATLMAYGYPPTHRTASITSNMWTYWKGRAGRVLVIFRDDKICDIQR